MSIIANQWQLQEAKNKLSQVVKEASRGVPQYITVRGKKAAVVLSTELYEGLKRPEASLSSALLLPVLDEEVIGWLDQQQEYTLHLSALTIAELNNGYYKLQNKAVLEDDKKRVDRIKQWIEKTEQRFLGKIIPIDANVLGEWSELCGRSESKGRRLPVIDSLLAATSLMHNLTLVTRNVADFKYCSKKLKLHNPY